MNRGIYGLLGASGCGKTTLLRCVLGRLQPKSGSIYLFGETPGTAMSRVPGPGVGYMPQELALYDDFSIEETLVYFGRLFGIKSKIIDSRIEFMINLLQLPNRKKLISQLSGGQKRRVSLSTALLHNPPLLILDEPTVGVDLILREAIWKHLENLCRTGLTVILTTHYIEEARSASNVGFMRSGRILAEDSPLQLLRRHQLMTLEEVFLKLSQLEDDMKVNNKLTFNRKSITNEILDTNIISSPEDQTSEKISLKVIKSDNSSNNSQEFDRNSGEGFVNNGFIADSTLPDEHIGTVVSKEYNLSNGVIQIRQQSIANETKFRNRLSALTLKNYRQMSRNVLLLSFFVLLPSIEICLLIMSIGQDIKNIPVSVYNPEKLETSQSLSELFLSSIDEKHITL
ncbi:unnamed protein product, partial [Medioppia subpectinata]